MRAYLPLAALGVVVGLGAASAQAQGLSSFTSTGQRASSFGSGQAVTNQVIDTSSAAAPFPGQRTSSSLVTLFRQIKFPGWPTTIGQSNYPSPSSYPMYADFQAAPFTPANSVNQFGRK